MKEEIKASVIDSNGQKMSFSEETFTSEAGRMRRKSSMCSFKDGVLLLGGQSGDKQPVFESLEEEKSLDRQGG